MIVNYVQYKLNINCLKPNCLLHFENPTNAKQMRLVATLVCSESTLRLSSVNSLLGAPKQAKLTPKKINIQPKFVFVVVCACRVHGCGFVVCRLTYPSVLPGRWLDWLCVQLWELDSPLAQSESIPTNPAIGHLRNAGLPCDPEEGSYSHCHCQVGGQCLGRDDNYE